MIYYGTEEDARRWGVFARDLFGLIRQGDQDAVTLFLEEMDELEVRRMLWFFVQSGGVLNVPTEETDS